MNLNLGDRVIWIEDDNKQQQLKGRVISTINNMFVIHWFNKQLSGMPDRTIHYSSEQIHNMEQGHYSGTMILDHQSIRQDKLQALGI